MEPRCSHHSWGARADVGVMSPALPSPEQDWRNPPTLGDHSNVEINAERLLGSVNITREKRVPGMKGGK